MRAGRLRHRINIQRLEKSRTPLGEVVESWNDLFTCHADVRPLTGKETYVSQQMAAEVNHEVTLRYRSDIKPADRIIDKQGRILDIKSVLDVYGRGRELKILCREVVK